MVVKKRIYYGGFHGLLAPVIPKAPRSLRRRSFLRKPSDDGGICAFELLAAVAGKLLQEQESESSTSSTGSKGKEQVSIPNEGVKHEPLEVDYKVKVSPVRSEPHDQGSGVESEPVAQLTNLDAPINELPHSENDSGLDSTSIVTNSDFMKKVNTDLINEAIEDKPENLCDINFGNRAKKIPATIDKLSGGLTSDVKNYNLKGQVESCVHTRLPNKSSSNVYRSFYKDSAQNAGFPRRRGDVNINSRDDDEKYFRFNNRSTRRRVFGPRSRAGYRRIRKMMSSRYWKAGPKLKDYEFADNTSGGVKSFYHKRKNIFMRDRCQTDAASKRKKLFHHNSKTSFIKEASGESKSNLVKFSIKSFKVPELYIDVPETATVGSLKRSVMEAVTAILQGKLHVGVLLQGKKVRDDSRTLQQTGISQNCNLDTLGFSLEPSLPEPCPSLVQKEIPLLLSRSPSSPTIDPGFLSSSPDPLPLVTTMESPCEKNEGTTTLPAEVAAEERMMDSKALVLVPPVDAGVLSMVPLSEKPMKRYELSQRRTRRPFSVAEVEALVKAVETLGAGRWRDVKILAFDDANHRTYVDLKDKWKTLVHTASIAPQQRRGEPVPQDLLDRVLAAHAYWSQHQSKQLGKHQKSDVKFNDDDEKM